MFYRSHSRRPTFDQRNIPQYFSYKEIFRILYHNIKNTISKFGHWIIHNVSSGEGCHNKFFSPPYVVKCNEITQGIEFRPPYTFSLEEKKRKQGEILQHRMSPCASRCYLLFQSKLSFGTLACDHFSPQIHLFFWENSLFRLV